MNDAHPDTRTHPDATHIRPDDQRSPRGDENRRQEASDPDASRPFADGDEGAAVSAERLPRPRVRVGAIIWGLIVATIGGLAVYVQSSPLRRADAVEFALGLTPLELGIGVVIALGVLVLLIAGLALLRRIGAPTR